MSTSFRGITETVPSLFRGIFSERNSVPNPTSNHLLYYRTCWNSHYRRTSISKFKSFGLNRHPDIRTFEFKQFLRWLIVCENSFDDIWMGWQDSLEIQTSVKIYRNRFHALTSDVILYAKVCIRSFWLYRVEGLYCKRPIQCLASFEILTPHPLNARRVCTPLPLVRGGGHTGWWRVGGGSIVRKTPDTALHSIYVSTMCCIVASKYSQ